MARAERHTAATVFDIQDARACYRKHFRGSAQVTFVLEDGVSFKVFSLNPSFTSHSISLINAPKNRKPNTLLGSRNPACRIRKGFCPFLWSIDSRCRLTVAIKIVLRNVVGSKSDDGDKWVACLYYQMASVERNHFSAFMLSAANLYHCLKLLLNAALFFFVKTAIDSVINHVFLLEIVVVFSP